MKKVIISTICIILSLIGCYVGLKAYVRWRLNKDYPWISVETIKISTEGLTLSGVRFHRHNLFGYVPTVYVNRAKDIRVVGGSIELSTDGEGLEEEKVKEHRVIVEGTDVTARKKDIVVYAKKVRRTPGVPSCASEASFEHPEASGHLIEPCVDRGIVTWSYGKISTKYFKDAQVKNGWVSKTDRRFRASSISVALSKDGQDPLEQTANDIEVTIPPSGSILVSASSITVENPVLNSSPLEFKRPLVAKFEDGLLTIEVDSVKLKGNVLDRTIEGTGTCADWAKNIPVGLQKPLESLSFSGSLSFFVGIKDPKVKISSSCKVSCKADMLQALSKPFNYEVYRADGKTLADRVSGPGSKGWTYLTEVSTFVPQAVVAMEDPGFLGHRGWIAGAFENSLKDNLRLGRFLRGGSTITMQLAKNLWLKREKTIGRKVQEFFLASALESCLSKDRILELYLNVVEFGPNVYGIGEAAKYRFDSSPAALDPRQAFWLAKILPNPRRGGKPSDADLARVDGLIQRVAPGLEIGPEDPDLGEDW